MNYFSIPESNWHMCVYVECETWEYEELGELGMEIEIELEMEN